MKRKGTKEEDDSKSETREPNNQYPATRRYETTKEVSVSTKVFGKQNLWQLSETWIEGNPYSAGRKKQKN